MTNKYIEVEGDTVIIENIVNGIDVKIVNTQEKYVLILNGVVYTEFSDKGGSWDEKGLKDFFFGFCTAINVFEITLTYKEE